MEHNVLCDGVARGDEHVRGEDLRLRGNLDQEFGLGGRWAVWGEQALQPRGWSSEVQRGHAGRCWGLGPHRWPV
jgi:hypothetical protein